MQSHVKLSVIVPVYNEEALVEHSLMRVLQADMPAVAERELIVVDDASSDGTVAVLDELVGKYPIEVIKHSRNMGKGAAIRTGIERASGDVVVFHDADLEYDPDDMNRMLVPILNGHADVVYGSRFVSGEVRRLLLFWHELGNKVITMLVNMVTNVNFSDIETCYKMFRASSLKSLKLVSNGFEIEPEITIKAARKKLRFYEVGIAYHGRTYQEGKKINWRDGFKAIWAIVRFGLFN